MHTMTSVHFFFYDDNFQILISILQFIFSKVKNSCPDLKKNILLKEWKNIF